MLIYWYTGIAYSRDWNQYIPYSDQPLANFKTCCKVKLVSGCFFGEHKIKAKGIGSSPRIVYSDCPAVEATSHVTGIGQMPHLCSLVPLVDTQTGCYCPKSLLVTSYQRFQVAHKCGSTFSVTSICWSWGRPTPWVWPAPLRGWFSWPAPTTHGSENPIYGDLC